MPKRYSLRTLGAVLGIIMLASGFAFSAPDKETGVSADEALRELIDGNKQYVENIPTDGTKNNSAARAALARTQKPYAIILTCSDSRVPPEIIFNKGLGEIFVIRVAGNIPDPVVLGSIEYAAEHLGSSLIMVLGHERCGAVTAAVEAHGKTTGSSNIDAIVKIIEPSVREARNSCDACKGGKDCDGTGKSEFVECVVDANAKRVAAGLTKRSGILRHLVENKKIKIVAAKYDLDEGTVTLYK